MADFAVVLFNICVVFFSSTRTTLLVYHKHFTHDVFFCEVITHDVLMYTESQPQLTSNQMVLLLLHDVYLQIFFSSIH
jgi:hypothetical protein